MTSWPFESTVTRAHFESEVWKQSAICLGPVDLSGLNDMDESLLIEMSSSDEVESRVIQQMDDGFSLTLGPFEVSELGPKQMLMVQNLESHLPSVAEWLSRSFSFLPRWKIEDVMATLGHQDANCGPHFDQYEVFLVQLTGEKTWSVDGGGHEPDDLDPDSEVRVLSEFTATTTMTLKTGEVLYVPPGVGHHGVASDNSITLSVGIRHPLRNEMASHLADMLIQTEDAPMGMDAGLFGIEIDSESVAALGQQLAEALVQPDLVNEWYGSFMTEVRDPELLAEGLMMEVSDVSDWLGNRSIIELDLPARIAIQGRMLFVNGECFQLEAENAWLKDLQQNRHVQSHRIGVEDHVIVQELLATGALATGAQTTRDK